MIDFIRRALGLYDSKGLRFSTWQLLKVHDQIALWPREKQAEYANISIIKNIDNTPYLNDQYKHFDPMKLFPGKLNATGIGNIAYCALYSTDLRIRNMSEKALNNLAYLTKLQQDAAG